MNESYIATPKRTSEIIKHHQFSFKKSLGQNFLIDVNILRKIIAFTGINKDSGVIEIGPGIGSLTEQLAIHAGKVIAYELDGRLLPILNETLKKYDNVDIVHLDFLKVDLQKVKATDFADYKKVHIIANLPYYVTTPILFHILEQYTFIENITVMLQKEVATRIAAQPNTKEYGSLSIAVQYYAHAKLLMDVPKTVFIPQPNVTSSILQLEIRNQPLVNVKDESLFFRIVQASFSHRRKTILNNLHKNFNGNYTKEEIDQLLHCVHINSTRRGESLSIEEFASLANVMVEKKMDINKLS